MKPKLYYQLRLTNNKSLDNFYNFFYLIRFFKKNYFIHYLVLIFG